MSYEILATPNSIARGRYSIGEKENNLFLKLMYAIQRDNKEYIIAENRKTELSEDDILKWKSLCEIETLICKLTPEDFNEIFKDIDFNTIKLNPNFADILFGEWVKNGSELSTEIKESFYWDNGMVQRRESKIFE